MTPATEARIRLACDALADALVAALDTAPDDHPPVDRLLSVAEAAAALGGIARSTIYREMARPDGGLRSVRVGSRRMIPSSAIAAYAAGQAVDR